MAPAAAAIHVAATVGTSAASSLPSRNWRSLIGVARIGSRVRCSFSPTIENAADVDEIAIGTSRRIAKELRSM